MATDRLGREIGRVTVHARAPAWWGFSRKQHKADLMMYLKLSAEAASGS